MAAITIELWFSQSSWRPFAMESPRRCVADTRPSTFSTWFISILTLFWRFWCPKKWFSVPHLIVRADTWLSPVVRVIYYITATLCGLFEILYDSFWPLFHSFCLFLLLFLWACNALPHSTTCQLMLPRVTRVSPRGQLMRRIIRAKAADVSTTVYTKARE